MTLRPFTALAALALALPPFSASSQPSPDNDALREQVMATERAFAKSMADRDHAAFMRFLADETIFFGGKGPLRGKQAVADAWKPFYEKPAAPFSWARFLPVPRKDTRDDPSSRRDWYWRSCRRSGHWFSCRHGSRGDA